MKPILKLIPTKKREMGGLIIFRLQLWAGGKLRQTWWVNSGQPGHQKLLTYADPESYSGDQRPIPEAVYRIGNLEFAGGAFDWADSWGAGLGDFWANIIRYANGKRKDTKRKNFGFHWDENRRTSPGSLGCIVFATQDDVEDFVEYMRTFDPQELVVDYGFGTVPKIGPTQAKAEENKPELQMIFHPKGSRLNVLTPLAVGSYPVATPPDGWEFQIGEKIA